MIRGRTGQTPRMTPGTDLRPLQFVAERLPEGLGVPVEKVTAAGFDVGELRLLQREGLLDVVDDDGDPTVVITEDGWDVLRPEGSL